MYREAFPFIIMQIHKYQTKDTCTKKATLVENSRLHVAAFENL